MVQLSEDRTSGYPQSFDEWVNRVGASVQLVKIVEKSTESDSEAKL